MAYSDTFVNSVQSNQRVRYNDLMRAYTMSALDTARKTREFRSPPQEQVQQSPLIAFFQIIPHDSNPTEVKHICHGQVYSVYFFIYYTNLMYL